jgi:GDP-L-fucose synthase
MADASVFLMNHYNEGGLVNVGCGADVSILELAQLIASVVEYDGTIESDPSKPDGTPRKLLDVSKLHALGWQHRITLPTGIMQVYAELAGADWQ